MASNESIDSKQVFRVIDLLSEGPIEGFPQALDAGLTPGTTGYDVAALKDTFFNNTPVLGNQASVSSSSTLTDSAFDGLLNFDMRGARFATRTGTQDQTNLEEVGDTNQRLVNVGVEVERKAQPAPDDFGIVSGDGTPVTRQITDTDVNQVRVTVGTPALFFAKPDGDVEGAKIQYKIEIRYLSLIHISEPTRPY